MHENLKYSVKLTDKIKPYINGTMINPVEDKFRLADWQAIYSGFDYSTHYLIYVKFIGKKQKDNSFKVDKTQVYIQNYDGAVSIGINPKFVKIIDDGKVTNTPDVDIRYPERNRFVLFICLEAFNNKNNFECCVDHVDPIIIKQNDILDVETSFSPANSTFTNIFNNESINEAKFVDEKFMKRLGSDVFITKNGEKQLNILYDLSIISEEDLRHTGLRIPEKTTERNAVENETTEKGVAKREKEHFRKSFEKIKLLTLGRVHPCIPRGSIFDIK